MKYENTKDDIRNACVEFGAKAVYEAASKRMSGNTASIPAVGLKNGASLGEANHIMTTAFELLSPVERASDLADVTIGLAKIPAGDKA